MAAPTLPNWDQALASEIGVPYSPGLGQFFNLWSRAEGGGAANNPFNTTQPGFGATGNYNPVGVKNYADPSLGIKATAATLKNGRYGNIIAAMRTGDPHAMAQALANSPWGTGALVLKMLGGGGGAPVVSNTGAAEPAPPPPGTLKATLTGKAPAAPAFSLAASQPSDAVVNLLKRISPMAGAAAQAAQATIPLPQLPVPAATAVAPAPRNGKGLPVAGGFKLGDPVVGGTGVGGEHATMGLAGYPAHDFFAPSGSEVVAPIGGKVIRLSGHDPKQGPTEGPHGPLGWSVYIKGNDGKTYFLTHMGSRSVKVGEKVKAGVPIGTVADYAAYGTPSHIHMGVSG